MTPIYDTLHDEPIGYIEQHDGYWTAFTPADNDEATEASFKTRLAAVRWLHRQTKERA
jgi:hypothetical protein